MSDATGAPARDAADEMSDEINRSMGTVWHRYTGERPKTISTEVAGDRIRCVIEGPMAPADKEEADETEADADAVALLTVSAQRNEAIEAVRRATHRRVVGFISKRDDTAGTSTQTFILDARRARN